MRRVVVAGLVAVVGVSAANAVELGGMKVGGGVNIGYQKVKNTGDMFDVKATSPVVNPYLTVEKNNIVGKLSVSYFKGSGDYTENNGRTFGIDLKHINYEVLGGYKFKNIQNNPDITLTPYVAIGRDVYTLTDDYGNEVKDKMTYGKLGLEIGYKMLYVNGYIGRSLSTDTERNYNSTLAATELKKKNRYGIEVGVNYKVNPNLALRTALFYDYKDAEYNTQDNKYKHYGVVFGIGF